MSDLPEWSISPAQLKAALAETPSKITLLDVREPEEVAESRIEGSRHIPLGELQARAAAELDPAADIVIYCAHGVRSLQALMALRLLGYDHLRSLEGGICAWQEMTG